MEVANAAKEPLNSVKRPCSALFSSTSNSLLLLLLAIVIVIVIVIVILPSISRVTPEDDEDFYDYEKWRD